MVDGKSAIKHAKRKQKIGSIEAYRFSATDLAIFGAAFALLLDKASRASDETFRKVFSENKQPKIDLELENLIIEVGGTTAEALVFSGLLSDLRKDLIKQADESYAEKYLNRKASEVVVANSGDSKNSDEFELTDILSLNGSLTIPLAETADAGGEFSQEAKSYTAQMQKMQDASDEFLEVMRELFANELETLIAKNQETKELTEQQPDDIEIAQLDVDAEGGGSYYALLGLLGLGGGGGGGGGLLSAIIGSGAASRLYSGFGIDGYVSGATVFWDIDGDFIQDANETVETTTDSSGFYELSGIAPGVGQIVIKNDGVDTNTGGSVGMMAASTNVDDSENANVTPLTLLKAQGISEDTIVAALGVDVSIDSYNPMAVLEGSSDDTELETAGTVLLKAQQLFGIVNSVAGLAEETGLSAAEALTETVNAIGGQDLSNFVGETGGDQTTLANIITQVAPDFTSVADSLAASLKNVNEVLGESLANPKNALGEDARAAALITQDDLVTQFKDIGRLGKVDVEMVRDEITSKLSSFGTVDDIKANFQEIYKATIQAQADSEGGIVTKIDSFTIKSGSGQLIDVSEILANDVNNGQGDLRLIAIEPAGLTYSTTIATSELVEVELLQQQDNIDQVDGIEGEANSLPVQGELALVQEDEGPEAILPQITTKTVYQLTVPDTITLDGYVKIKFGPFSLLERVQGADTPESIATRIVNTINNEQNEEDPLLIVENIGSTISFERNDGSEMRASIAVAEDNAAIDAKIITDENGNSFVSVDTGAAVNTNLRYIVANDTGQGHGNIRLTVEPDFRSLSLNPGRQIEVDEDGILSLSEQIVFNNTASPNVSEKLFFKLVSIDGTNGDFILDLGSSERVVEVGILQQIPLSQLETAQLIQPENFHGNFEISFDLTGSFEQFSSRSSTESSQITVIPIAETASDQATIKLVLGDVESDLEGSIIPVVGGTPSASQITKIKLEGGDISEIHSVEFFGIPEGMSVSVNGTEKEASFGRIIVEEASLDNELNIQFNASNTLIDSSFGLFEGVSAVVVGQDGIDRAAGGEINFTFDIGGAYGLNVSSQSVTISEEDIASALGGLDITSIESGASVEILITLTEQTASSESEMPLLGIVENDIFTQLSGENISVEHSIGPVNGLRTVTYTIFSNDPMNVLDPFKVLHPSEHFKGEIIANAEIRAKMAQDDGSFIDLASVTKGPMSMIFEAVADTVSYDLSLNSLEADEDSAISVRPLFFDAEISRATSKDNSEEIVYVVSGMPSGTRLIDGEALKDADGNELTDGELKVAIPLAPSIGTIIGDDIELTAVEASRANIVTFSDRHLDSNSIQVSAYSRELGTSKISSLSGNHAVNIAINAVADAPYLSLDSRVRGLVDDNLSPELQSKAIVKIPASAALMDTDGSETLWAKITPNNSDAGIFSFSGADYLVASDSSYILLRASDLSTLEITMPAGNGGYNDLFNIEAIAVESSGISGSSFADIAAEVDVIINTIDSKLFATTPSSIEVEFLQPAKAPTLSLSTISYGSEPLDNGQTQYYAQFQLDIEDKQISDVVTILATGVPAVAGAQTKFYRYKSENEQYQDIGAPAEVAGVWVFSYSDVFDEDTDQPYDLRIGLPSTYSYSTGASNMEFTAFSVDSLGLTNAKSETASQSVDLVGASFGSVVPADAADPIVIDTSGDGWDFVSQVPGVAFDINSDGVADNIGWLNGIDDAFLVLLPEDNFQVPVLPEYGELTGNNLITEYLVSPTTTDALADLFSVDAESNGDAILTKAELQSSEIMETGANNVPYLWFDNGDGVANYSELASLSDNFSVNLADFNDTTVITSSGTVIAAAQVTPGSITGDYTFLNEDGSQSDNSISLNSALAADVFFPIAPPTTQKQAIELTGVSLSDNSIYFEDADSGFDISSILQDSQSESWESAFGENAWTAISQGSKVLLTIQAKNVGTYFNLSEGARLEDEPKDTWLTLWDPIARSDDKPSGKEKFDIFLRDNFSGNLELEVRATVVYTDGLQPREVTVQRDIALDIAPVADRPEFLVPQTSSEISEGEENTNIVLNGIELVTVDSGETSHLILKPEDDNPSELVSVLFKGIEIEPNSSGNYEISGNVTSGDIIATIPAFASGTYAFKLSAFAKDGEIANENDSSPINDIPFNFIVTPTAQAPIVSTSIAPSIVVNGISESEAEFNVAFNSTLVDTDGSEEISSMTIFVSGDTTSPLTEAPTFISDVGTVFPLSTHTSYLDDGYGVFKVIIPKSELSLDENTSTYSISGVIQTPAYFDGMVKVSSEATSVEKSDTSARSTNVSEEIVINVNPVADGFTEDGFVTSGTSTQAGDPIYLSSIIKSLNTVDPDETINLRLFGMPEGSVLFGNGNVEIQSSEGSYYLNQVTLNEMNSYHFKTNSDQENFNFSIGASTQDDLNNSTEQIRTINIASSALYSPVFLSSSGDTLDANLSFQALEGGSGILDLSVALGDQLNPRDVNVIIENVPSGFIVKTPSGDSADTLGSSFQISANKLSQGLIIEAGPEATQEEKNFIGNQSLSISANIDYTVDGVSLSKNTSLDALLTIEPVTDGVTFALSKTIDEDGTFNIFDFVDVTNSIVQRVDNSEDIERLVISRNDNFQISYQGSSGFISLAEDNVEIIGEGLNDLSQLLIKPNENFNGLSNLGISVQSIARSTDETGGLEGELITQQALIPISVTAVVDELVLGTGGLSSSADVSFAQMINIIDLETNQPLEEPLVNDGRIDLIQNLEIGIQIPAFSTLDSSETVTAIISGDAITAGSRIISGTGISEIIYAAEEIAASPGSFQIILPGEGADFVGLNHDDTRLVIPKDESGYGIKTINLALRGTDGDIENILFETNQSLSILSTIPPEPLTGLSYEIGTEEFTIEHLKDNGLNLLDLVRVPQLNESHILQVLDLPDGVRIEVGTEILPTAFIRTHPDENKMPVVQLTSEQLQTAVVKISEEMDGEYFNLNFQVRVGTSDGLSSNGVDTRHVYSRLVEFDANLFNKSTDGNDVLIASETEISSGKGDDKIFVTETNISEISGGQGNDSLSFNQVNSENNIFIDLNMGKLIVSDETNISSLEKVNNISGIENIIGGQGSDTIVANESSTQSMTLRGNGGDDYLVGGQGNDFLEGGQGNDLLSGASGANTFIFTPNNGIDTILDFKQGDIIQLNGYGITPLSNGNLPPEVTILEAPNNQNDWHIQIFKSVAGIENSSTIVLSGLKTQYTNYSQIESLVLSSVIYSEDLNMDTTDPLESKFELGAPVMDIIHDLSSDRDDFFGSEFNFNDITDDISSALGIIADAKYQEALIVTDKVSDLNNIRGFKEALLDENSEFRGLSGSTLDDVLVAEDSDSVLFGGNGGADRLIGGSGDDILISSKSEDNAIDNLAGGAGSDLFTLINPKEIDENLNSIYQVKIEDFNREEGDRVVLLGYQDGNEIELSEVDPTTNTQSATISHNNVDNLTIHFDLSFAREFDSNFSLRMADFDKFEAA